jgi:streptogramin lyase
MPFGRSVVAMDVAPDGRVWFAASTLASLVWFDQLEQRFHLEARDGAGLSALSARAAGIVWFAYSSGHNASVLARLNLARGTTDEYRLSGVGDVQALFADERGTLWVSTTVGGLFSFRDGQTGTLLGGSGSGVFSTGPDGWAWFLQNGPAGTRLYKLGDSSAPLPAGARGLTIDANGRAWVADGDNPAFFILRSLGQ